MATALLLVDLQRGMFSQEQVPHDGEAVLRRVSDLLGRAREQGVAVLHVRHDGGQGDALKRGTAGWEIHPAVAPQGTEPVIDKDRCSAFDRSDLHARLSARGIDRLIVAGMQTEFCIDTNCRAAHALGYSVVLASDGHTTFDTPSLTAAQVVEHHTRILHWGGFVEPVACAEVRLD
jgi:nicotinamidase-related amidase